MLSQGDSLIFSFVQFPHSNFTLSQYPTMLKPAKMG